MRHATSAIHRPAAIAAVLVALFGIGWFGRDLLVGGTEQEAAARGPLKVRLADRTVKAGAAAPLSFRIEDPEGHPLRSFEVAHEKRLHMILVRRDLSGFQHVHPTMAADGTWSIPVRFKDPGPHRLFADFKAAGKARVLHTDLTVDGEYAPQDLPGPTDTATAPGGYAVRLSRAGEETVFHVRHNGKRVRDLEPYLGARGHLVALREGDLAYLHVHPTSKATQGGDIRFIVSYPDFGGYRLFLQFKHAGRVHTTAFTQIPDVDAAEDGADHEH